MVYRRLGLSLDRCTELVLSEAHTNPRALSRAGGWHGLTALGKRLDCRIRPGGLRAGIDLARWAIDQWDALLPCEPRRSLWPYPLRIAVVTVPPLLRRWTAREKGASHRGLASAPPRLAGEQTSTTQGAAREKKQRPSQAVSTATRCGPGAEPGAWGCRKCNGPSGLITAQLPGAESVYIQLCVERAHAVRIFA
jgi:hypothetical protein